MTERLEPGTRIRTRDCLHGVGIPSGAEGEILSYNTSECYYVLFPDYPNRYRKNKAWLLRVDGPSYEILGVAPPVVSLSHLGLVN